MKQHRLDRILALVSITLTVLVVAPRACFAGGTTGGGGNVQISEQVPETNYRYTIQNSKTVLVAWLSKTYQYYQLKKSQNSCSQYGSDCDLYAKIFDGPKTIFRVLQNLEIEGRTYGPCMNFNHKPNDGSMYGQKPGSVCISISNIKVKLRQSDYEQQAAALILHEISHLLGTDEDQANRLQWLILAMGFRMETFLAVQSAIITTEGSMKALTQEISSMQYGLSRRKDFNITCTTIRFYKDNFSEVLGKLKNRDFYFLTPAMADLFEGTYVKLEAAHDYACGQDPNEQSASRADAMKTYNTAFGPHTEITARDYIGSTSFGGILVKVNKITDRAAFDREILDVSKNVKIVSDWYSNVFLQSRFTVY